jgi:hypothetical protein
MRWIAVVAAMVLAAVSAYGWWFYFAVGPAHDAGFAIGIVGSMLAAVALFFAITVGGQSN